MTELDEAIQTLDVARVRALHAQAGCPGTLRWALALVEVGAADEADALRDKLSQQDQVALFALMDDSVGEADLRDEEDEREDDELVRREAPSEANVALVDSFLRWFGGRRDLYATQWYDARRGRGGYRPVRQPLTRDVVRRHLKGEITLGQYPLYSDQSVAFAVLDLDLHSSALAELAATAGEDSRAADHPVLQQHVARLQGAAAQLQVPLHLVDSGGKGVHLWCFFEPRRSARAARQLLAMLVELAGPPPTDLTVERFPKQDLPGKRGLSSLIKLPLGVHRRTARRCTLLDAKFRPIVDPLAELRRYRAVDAPHLDAILGGRLIAMPLPGAHSETVPPVPRPPAPTARSLAASLRQLGDSRVAADQVLGGCRQLRHIVDAAFRDRAIATAEARAIVYSLGLLGAKPVDATNVLVAAGAPMRELHRVRNGLPSPVGCRRIAALSNPARCEGCSMQSSGALPYASPVFFALRGLTPERAPVDVALADELQPDVVEQLGDAVTELHHRLQALESGANTGVDTAGTAGAAKMTNTTEPTEATETTKSQADDPAKVGDNAP